MEEDNSKHAARQRDMPSESRPKHLSPLRLFAIIAFTVFLGEVLVMIVLESLPEMPTLIEALSDGLMITLIATPALVLFLIRPLALHIERREIAEEKLRTMNDTLEDLVAQRTAELTAANAHLKKEIEERTTAEQRLSRSAEFLNQILVAAPCVLAIYDVNTMECSFVNDRVTDLLGYSTDEVLLKGAAFFEEVFSEETFDIFGNLNSRIAAGIEDEIMKCECLLRTADDELQPFSIGVVTVKKTPAGAAKDILLAAVPSEKDPFVGHSELDSHET
jgi:PAS domain-containing protein